MTSTKSYEILWTDSAKAMLAKISDKCLQAKIIQKAEGLCFEPEKQGKALVDDLWGYRSLRAVGQRYRIIYKVEREKVVVYVVAVGIRKEKDRYDIYELAKKIVRLKLV